MEDSQLEEEITTPQIYETCGIGDSTQRIQIVAFLSYPSSARETKYGTKNRECYWDHGPPSCIPARDSTKVQRLVLGSQLCLLDTSSPSPTCHARLWLLACLH